MNGVMRMNVENYKGLKKQLETQSLDIASQLTILELAYKNEQQLQAYKDKEDKLRELVRIAIAENPLTLDAYVFVPDILQILNEGDK